MAAAFRKAAKSRQREHRERSQVGPHRPHERRPVASCATLAPSVSPFAGPGSVRRGGHVNKRKCMLTTPACLGRSLAAWRGGGSFSFGEEYSLPSEISVTELGETLCVKCLTFWGGGEVKSHTVWNWSPHLRSALPTA